ncbi:MAG: HD domain-containing protein, partial [Myxococcales bacterium]|nr:HD domain-containing protein [Myxococcales bacterium]
PPRLIRHGELVGEAADLLLARLRGLGVRVDGELVRLGAVLHDAGKVLHPLEFEQPGAEHEPAGEALLLEHGVSPAVARMCLSHARWSSMAVSLEELLVALADKLWKGARKPDLEQRVIDRVADAVGRARWDVFVELDTLFEEVAADGSKRLERSVTSGVR